MLIHTRLHTKFCAIFYTFCIDNVTQKVYNRLHKGGVRLKRSIDIPDNLYKRLQAMAEIKGISVAALIKLACSEYLSREEKN